MEDGCRGRWGCGGIDEKVWRIVGVQKNFGRRVEAKGASLDGESRVGQLVAVDDWQSCCITQKFVELLSESVFSSTSSIVVLVAATCTWSPNRVCIYASQTLLVMFK